MRQRPAGHPEGMRERQRVRIPSPRERPQRGFVHQGPDREVGEEKAPGFLSHERGRLAPQDTLPTPQVRLQLVERRICFSLKVFFFQHEFSLHK